MDAMRRDLESWATDVEKCLQMEGGYGASASSTVPSFAISAAPTFAGTAPTARMDAMDLVPSGLLQGARMQSKVPLAFANRRAAARALPAQDLTEFMAGRMMDSFATRVCSQFLSEASRSKRVLDAKMETHAMENAHRQALGLPARQQNSLSSKDASMSVEALAIEELRQRTLAQRESGDVAANDRAIVKHSPPPLSQDSTSAAQMQQQMEQQYMVQMQQQMQQQLQQQMQTIMQGGIGLAAAQQPGSASSVAVESSTSFEDVTRAASGEGSEPPDKTVFDAVFAAQQAQYMQQMQFMHSVRAESSNSNQLIGMPTGPLLECRFTNDFRPLQFCKKYFTAEGCARGAKCTYAHCAEELHPNSPLYPKHLEASASGSAALVEQESQDEPAKMPDMRMKKKKELCNKWKKDGDGSCILGKACPFAHGEHEIGMVELVICEKVKIKLCNFWEKGKCVYGKNCINAHGKEEIGMKRPDFRMPVPFSKKRKEGESIEEWRSTVLKM